MWHMWNQLWVKNRRLYRWIEKKSSVISLADLKFQRLCDFLTTLVLKGILYELWPRIWNLDFCIWLWWYICVFLFCIQIMLQNQIFWIELKFEKIMKWPPPKSTWPIFWNRLHQIHYWPLMWRHVLIIPNHNEGLSIIDLILFFFYRKFQFYVCQVVGHLVYIWIDMRMLNNSLAVDSNTEFLMHCVSWNA